MAKAEQFLAEYRSLTAEQTELEREMLTLAAAGGGLFRIRAIKHRLGEIAARKAALRGLKSTAGMITGS